MDTTTRLVVGSNSDLHRRVVIPDPGSRRSLGRAVYRCIHLHLAQSNGNGNMITMTSPLTKRQRIDNDIITKDCYLEAVALRLEAIFHPKFDNENQTSADIRQSMLERVSSCRGYLEISLKHSGSLVLWSGASRYYSKNAAENQFTFAGEILLRQHFARAWADDGGTDTKSEGKYQECSRFVESNRLTLAFEVVTSLLGQHGDVPQKDFLILTAIADRSAERFFNTSELVEFSQHYRLPHNDFWLFKSEASSKALFDLYDSTREIAHADGTVAALTASSDEGHIQSIYPHFLFQGNILEGIVIRYVPYEGAENSKNFRSLAIRSEQILKEVPPDREPSFRLLQGLSTSPPNSVLERDIKSLPSDGDDELFRGALEEMLLQTDRSRRRKIKMLRHNRKEVASKLLELANAIISEGTNAAEADIDKETQRIARLIQRIDQLNIPAEYTLREETTSCHCGGEEPVIETRLLCTVHIKNDFAFQKYSRQMKDEDMSLFRGFVIQLVSDGKGKMQNTSRPNAFPEKTCNIAAKSSSNAVEREVLMMKMKFLPYMVRTFGIRNGLSVVDKSGPDGYTKYTMGLLKTWGVSQEAVETWQPFFQAWGLYAQGRLGSNDPKTKLNAGNYLRHLADFSNSYYSGKLSENMSSAGGQRGKTFGGLIIVVSLARESAEFVSSKIASSLGSRHSRHFSTITENDILLSKLKGAQGLVCSAVVEDGVLTRSALVKKYQDSVAVIFLGCDDATVLASIESGSSALKKRKGMLKSWRNGTCRAQIDIKYPSDSMEEDISNFVDSLQESTEDIKVQPGLLIFFPAIPGSGKSSICRDLPSSIGSHYINVCVADKTRGKYWPLVQTQRLLEPSSILVADKNAPHSVFETIGSISANSRGVPVPVLPDDGALSSTTVEFRTTIGNAIEGTKYFTFPFSLAYLAVCIQRVLDRPEKSHCGKLDRSCNEAGMIVVQFYCLYQNLSADQLIIEYRNAMEKSGAPHSFDPLRIPFFEGGTPPSLPNSVVNVLKDAIRLQIRRGSSKSSTDEVGVMERRLREVLRPHKDAILSCVAAEEESRHIFHSGIDELTQQLDNMRGDDFSAPKHAHQSSLSFIKIASIDIDFEKIQNILKELASVDGAFSSFLDDIGAFSVTGEPQRKGHLVKKTHVTMAHFSSLSQLEMRSKFASAIGQSVELKVISCLHSQKSAALFVELSPNTLGELPIPLPVSQNISPHITIWYADGGHAVDSNQLPELVNVGDATETKLAVPISLGGKISYWMMGNEEP